MLAGGIDHELGNERPAQSSGQRILALVNCAGHQGRDDETIDEEIASVNGDGIDGPGLECLLADALDVLALAQVHCESDHVEVVFLAQPRHHDRGVETAAVSKDDFIAGHLRTQLQKDEG